MFFSQPAAGRMQASIKLLNTDSCQVGAL